MPVSRIDSSGRVLPVARTISPTRFDPKDVQDPEKLALHLGRVASDSAAANSRYNPTVIIFEDVTLPGDGSQVRLPHDLGNSVRWAVEGFREPTTGGVAHPELWVRRVINGPGTLARIAGDYTVGTRFTTTATSGARITGARFPWVSTGGTSTVTATLWRDPVGAFPALELAHGSVTCTSSGIYHAAFGVPADLSSANLSIGADLTLGIYDGGSGYPKTGVDTVFTALLPFAYPGITLKDLRLYSAGNARPTSTAATELYWVEPSFAASSRLAEDATATDQNTLVLRSWAAGVATIRIETE